MTVQTQRAQHPFALFCRTVFNTGPCNATPERAKLAATTLADLAAMPKQTQLLLAHSLERINPDLTLLEDDPDVCALLSAGWLIPVSCPSAGVICFRIERHVWSKLRSMRRQLLSDDLLFELKTYRKRKSALYPWLW